MISFLLTTTELYHLFKLPELVQHFQEHRAQNIELTIGQFIKIHYAQVDDIKNSDYDKDMKLPFKKHEFTRHTTATVIVAPVTSQALVHPPPYTCERKLLFQGKYFISSLLTANIWQPPRA